MTDRADQPDRWGHTPRYYVRLGKLIALFEKLEPEAYQSRISTVARTWRMAFAWRLARALGLPVDPGNRGVDRRQHGKLAAMLRDRLAERFPEIRMLTPEARAKVDAYLDDLRAGRT